jgi:hypothetical protein
VGWRQSLFRPDLLLRGRDFPSPKEIEMKKVLSHPPLVIYKRGQTVTFTEGTFPDRGVFLQITDVYSFKEGKKKKLTFMGEVFQIREDSPASIFKVEADTLEELKKKVAKTYLKGVVYEETDLDILLESSSTKLDRGEIYSKNLIKPGTATDPLSKVPNRKMG